MKPTKRELLEALIFMRKQFQEYYSAHPDDHVQADYDCIKKANEVIKKATE